MSLNSEVFDVSPHNLFYVARKMRQKCTLLCATWHEIEIGNTTDEKRKGRTMDSGVEQG
ncbi:unnamed protein product [Brugia pahangi]|uniref:Uncharacterized protein n=1 Tax=Brugia pahangi TaxID=6280 RepID=A0A0N4SWS3_BRUPA|nr:unnamed protein product [Brugia pahangi]